MFGWLFGNKKRKEEEARKRELRDELARLHASPYATYNAAVAAYRPQSQAPVSSQPKTNVRGYVKAQEDEAADATRRRATEDDGSLMQSAVLLSTLYYGQDSGVVSHVETPSVSHVHNTPDHSYDHSSYSSPDTSSSYSSSSDTGSSYSSSDSGSSSSYDSGSSSSFDSGSSGGDF